MKKLHASKDSLNKTPERRERGRPRRIDPSIVEGAADAYRALFQQFWPKLGPRILAARSAAEIVKAIQEDAIDVSTSLVPFSELILKIVSDRRFPRARPT